MEKSCTRREARGQPGGVLVADVAASAARSTPRGSPAGADLRGRSWRAWEGGAGRHRGRVALRRRAVEVEDHLALGVDRLQPLDQLERPLDLPLGVVRTAEDERELGDHPMGAAEAGGLEGVLDAAPFLHRAQHLVAPRLGADVGHPQPAAADQLPGRAENPARVSARA